MKILDYDHIMGLDPTTYNDEPFVNALGQEMFFLEHPILGDLHPVLVHFPKEKVVACTDFFETDDMMAEHGEYAPVLIDGEVDCQFHHDIYPNKIPEAYRHLLPKRKYKVFARSVSLVYVNVEATTEIEARQIADTMDDGDFIPSGPKGYIELSDVELLNNK